MEQILAELRDSNISTELLAIGRLSPVQSLRLNAIYTLCMLLKVKNLALIRDGNHYIADAEFNSGQTISFDGWNPKKVSQEDLAIFSTHGVAGPFKLLDQDETSVLEQHVEEAAYSTNNPIYKLIAAKDADEAALLLEERDVILGVNMFMFDERVRAILADEELAAVVKDLIATDRLACWRSQIFRQVPDGGRTYYHQNVDFADMSKHPSFTHRKGEKFKPNSALSVWISLCRSTIDAGTMSVLAGSFCDTRAYDLQKYFLNNIFQMLNAVSFFPPRQIHDMLKIFLFSRGGHRGKSKVLMTIAQFFYDDLFAGDFTEIPFVAEPGEYFAFSSFNLHGSRPTAPGLRRSTLVGRYVDEKTVDVGDNEFILPIKGGGVPVSPPVVGFSSSLRL
ncbi:MAG: phytanoyl-CoA dioxygenase family protein [Pseudomonadota bacterium]